MTIPPPVLAPEGVRAPTAPFARLGALWIQLTGTWCNLECTHCLNASGPTDPWLRPLAPAVVHHALAEAERLGVREIYFTGGEPFLHRQILPLLEASLVVAPTTVLTNGTALTVATADALRALADRARYSLEIRVSLDDVEQARNDRVRGRGAFSRTVRTLQLLEARGLLPIVAVTEILREETTAEGGLYERFHRFLRSIGIARPRVKIIPVFAVGRLEGRRAERLTDAALEGFDRGMLQCAETRVVADGGVYACPILAGLPGARLSSGSLEAAFRPAPLYHTACVTCHRTGMSCRNF
ncbi:MAG TPA: radical SAM protein [Methylomirabilota bacterium]|nr:radical SAM protein [Methylomirabilota bacterium]